MKYLFFVLLSTFTFNNVFAQGTYPLQIGNVWQYIDSYDLTYAWTDRVTSDTILPNGLTYSIIMADHATYGPLYRQDGSKVFYYGRNPSSDTTYIYYEELLFDFSKKYGDTVRVTIQDNPPDTIIVTILDDRTMDVFGTMRKTWTFFETSKRTSGYAIRQVADSIGMIYTAGEGGTAFSLSGAIINGKQYGVISSVDKNAMSNLPKSYALIQNYPNPFNGSTIIGFIIPKDEYISLTIYNLLGQKIASIAKGYFSSGEHELLWNSGNVSSGNYFYQLQTKTYSETKKLTIIK